MFLTKKLKRISFSIFFSLFFFASHAFADASSGQNLGELLPAWSILPFMGVLLSIALFPLLAANVWHHHHPKIVAAWSLTLAIPFLYFYRSQALHSLLHTAILDYIPFMILIATLYTISGGIYIKGTLLGSPKTNVVLLSIRTGLASWIGTTGAAMLMIRPILRANRHRRHKVHTVIFFIFLVANIGGCLTPLGDPPLFLGFLHGVPFLWTLRLWKEMLFLSVLLLGIYFAVDTFFWSKEDVKIKSHTDTKHPIQIEGLHNFLFLGGTLLAVILSGLWHPGAWTIEGLEIHPENVARDVLLLLMLTGALFTTKEHIHKENEFSWGPIHEVAILFGAIFTTMIPALAILEAGEKGSLCMIVHAVKSPAHFFWASGVLSSFLDNAPTYLTFLSTSLGRLYPNVPERMAIAQLITENHTYLKAISLGSVFMGANTYIGNAPNFMVKSMAEKYGFKMPSFFGYIFCYSLPILVSSFILVTWIFF
ncbi:MAG: sodium:proton antiporter [Chlamydiae bacterium]|nr:sodium:proton antiporter [Chlamydiota bacterium]